MTSQETMLDRNGSPLELGDTVVFFPHRGAPRKGVVEGYRAVQNKTAVRLEGDPFAVCLNLAQVESRMHNIQVGKQASNGKEESEMGEMSSKELRRKARELDIEGWEDMTRQELAAAVAAAEDDDFEDDEDDLEFEEEEEEEERPVKKSKKAAKKSSKKGTKKSSKSAPKAEKKSSAKPKAKAKAKSKASQSGPRRAAASTNGRTNPFREGSNNHLIVEALKRGGTKGDLIDELHGVMVFRPRVSEGVEYEREIVNSRMNLVARILKNEYNWNVRRDGTGDEAHIKATPPRR